MNKLRKYIPIFVTLIFCTALIAVAFAQDTPVKKAEPKAPRPKNLKVLPQTITGDSLHTVMVGYAKSLGVHCTFCHVATSEKPMKFDWASDSKPEKVAARAMMRMTHDINTKYIGKMGREFGTVTCATCHMGKTTPLESADSLPKQKS